MASVGAGVAFLPTTFGQGRARELPRSPERRKVRRESTTTGPRRANARPLGRERLSDRVAPHGRDERTSGRPKHAAALETERLVARQIRRIGGLEEGGHASCV